MVEWWCSLVRDYLSTDCTVENIVGSLEIYDGLLTEMPIILVILLITKKCKEFSISCTTKYLPAFLSRLIWYTVYVKRNPKRLMIRMHNFAKSYLVASYTTEGIVGFVKTHDKLLAKMPIILVIPMVNKVREIFLFLHSEFLSLLTCSNKHVGQNLKRLMTRM